MPRSAWGIATKQEAHHGRDAEPDRCRDPHPLDRALRLLGAEILAGHRGGGPHQSHRGPGDEREELDIPDGVRCLRLRTHGEGSDVAEQEDASDVHCDSLHSGWQSESKQGPDHRPVGFEPGVGPADDQPPLGDEVQADPARDQARDHRSQRRSRGPQPGNRPKSRDQDHIQTDVEQGQQDAEPHRSAGIAGGAERGSQHVEEHHADARHQHDPEVGQCFGAHFSSGVDQAQQGRGEHPTERCQDPEGERRGGDHRLVERAVHLLGVVLTGEAGHQHAHTGKQGVHENDDDDEDLDGDADRGVAGVPDEVAHHRVIYHPLHASDDVLDHRRPGKLPDGPGNRSFHDRPIERSGCGGGSHRVGNVGVKPGF